MALKRAGRGHDPAGVANTPTGSVAVECPACPHPGRNLPKGWELAKSLLYVFGIFSYTLVTHVTVFFRYLYILYVSVDANFKLKGKERGLKDIDLLPGWGTYVDEPAYQAFLSNYVDQPEVRVSSSPFERLRIDAMID
jgi:hypothetical protein